MNITETQKEMIIDALVMAEKSQKRMQASRPQFAEVAGKIRRDLEELISVIRAHKTETPKSSK